MLGSKLYFEMQLTHLMRELGAEVGKSERQTQDYVLQVVTNLTKTLEAQSKSI
jgi:hypothetical protein